MLYAGGFARKIGYSKRYVLLVLKFYILIRHEYL
jgi:hypothetical protein